MRILVGVSGASGSVYGIRFINILKKLGHEIHVIVSEAGEEIMLHETGESSQMLAKQVDCIYDNRDLFAGPASGSFSLQGMVIIPCSMKTLSSVASGYADTLMARAALCQLKEKRPLILVVRETPIDLIGLRNMVAATEAGAVILPASPGFYHKPKVIGDLVDFIIGKVLDQLEIKHSIVPRWKDKKQE